jgi:hypothetical protein
VTEFQVFGKHDENRSFDQNSARYFRIQNLKGVVSLRQRAIIILMKTSRLILIAAVLFLIAWLLVPQRDEFTVKPLRDLDSVREIAPSEWVDLVTAGQNTAPGTVFIPQKTAGVEFRSGVRPESRGFLSPEVCSECHAENYRGFLTTAHAFTSREPDDHSILGSFAEERSMLSTRNPDLWFKMLADTTGFYQQLTVQKDRIHYTEKRSIDLVIGSGNHGQAYLSWEGDHLYQMHVSYLTESDQWVNSPGMYVDGTADFARPVPGRCLDCHTTWFSEDATAVNRFDRSNYLLGVTCVRCHGPGHEHVAYHREHPDEGVGRQIVNPSGLSRDRINELCAQCHSAGEPLAPSFTYRPGEPLSEYLELDLAADAPTNEDPHSANQLARLMKSKCYIASETMTCITCHDPHQDQRGDTSGFSRTCQQCHQPESCREQKTSGSAINDRCVECHMPSRRDEQVSIEMKSGTLMALIRDHLIGKWPATSDRVRAKIAADAQSQARSARDTQQSQRDSR